MVCLIVIPKDWHIECQTADENCVSRSDVIMEGGPNQETQPCNMARATVMVVSGGKWNCRWPSRKPINDGQEVCGHYWRAEGLVC